MAKSSHTSKILFSFGLIGGVLVFVLAYLIGSRPPDYGPNLSARLQGVRVKIVQCQETQRRLFQQQIKVQKLEDKVSDDVNKLESGYEQLTARHENCENLSQNYSELHEQCKEQMIHLETLIHDSEVINSTTVDALKAIRRTETSTGNVGTLVKKVTEDQEELTKQSVIRALLKEVSERVAELELVDKSCKKKKEEEKAAKEAEKKAAKKAKKAEEAAEEEEPKPKRVSKKKAEDAAATTEEDEKKSGTKKAATKKADTEEVAAEKVETKAAKAAAASDESKAESKSEAKTESKKKKAAASEEGEETAASSEKKPAKKAAKADQ